MYVCMYVCMLTVRQGSSMTGTEFDNVKIVQCKRIECVLTIPPANPGSPDFPWSPFGPLTRRRKINAQRSGKRLKRGGGG